MAGVVAQEHLSTSCSNDPHFATICSFIEKFGESCHIGAISFDELQRNLENTNEIVPALAQIHILLLRRIYRSINAEKWEKHLVKFAHSYDSQDAWEIERFGYKKAKIQTKLILLKNLLESQFDFNTKFKNEVNKLPAEDLRRVPLGCDSEGQVYWYQVDTEANLRVYREDVDDDTWELVATSREEMVTLISQLESGVVKKNSTEEDNGLENGGEGDSPKEILLDTGKVSDEQESDEGDSPEGPEDTNDADDDEDDDAMAIDEDYKPESESMEVAEDVPDASSLVKTEIKNEEKERINTFELGKAVRRMLDTPSNSNKYDIKTKLPEIKLEPKSVTIPDNIQTEADSKPIVKSEVEPDVIESESVPRDSPVLDPETEPKIPNEVVKPELIVTAPAEEPSTSEVTRVTDFQKEKSPLDSLRLFTDKMSAELKVSDKVLKEVHHTDIQDVMKKMDEFEKLNEVEQPFKSSRNGQAAASVHKSMPSPRLDLKPPKATSTKPQVVGSSTFTKAEASKASNKLAPPAPEAILKPTPVASQAAVNVLIKPATEALDKLQGLAAPKIFRPSVEACKLAPEIKIQTASEPLGQPASTALFEPVPEAVLESAPVACKLAPAPELKIQNASEHAIQPTSTTLTEPAPKAVLTPAHVALLEPTAEVLPKPAPEASMIETAGEASVEPVPAALLESAPKTSPALTEIVKSAAENVIQPAFEESIKPVSVVFDQPEEPALNLEQVEKERETELVKEPEPETTRISQSLEIKPATVAEIDDKNVSDLQIPMEQESVKEVLSDKPEVEPISGEAVHEPIVQKSSAWVTGNEKLPEHEELRQQENLSSSANDTLQSLKPEHDGSLPLDLVPGKDIETQAVPEPSPQVMDTFGEIRSIAADLPNIVPHDNKESPHKKSEVSATVTETPGMAPAAEAKSLSGLVGYAYSSSDEDETFDKPTSSAETKSLPAADSIKANSDSKPDKIETSSGKPAELRTLVNENTNPSVPSVTNDQAPVTSDSVKSLKSAITPEAKDEANVDINEPQAEGGSSKRKAEEPLESPENAKVLKMVEEPSKESTPFNPIVGEAIEEEMVIITGQGSGAELQGGNESPELSPAEPLAVGKITEAGNIGQAEGSVEDEGEDNSDDSVTVVAITPKGRGRPKQTPGSTPSRRGRPRGGGGGRGRGRGRGSAAQGSRDRSSSASVSSTPVAIKGEVNGKLRTERPTRQSSRIATIQVKEEEERRKLEEQRLAQLKAAQLKKQKKQLEQDQSKSTSEVKATKSKPRGRGQSEESARWETTTPSPSEENDSDAAVSAKPKKRGRKKKKNGAPPKTLMQKGLNPWTHTSSEDEDEVAEEEEEYHDHEEEEEEEELVFRSDHEFSPESDLGEEDADVFPSRHARTAKIGEVTVDKYDKTNCSKCSKGDHPEWILLCDSCDSACHASCLRPQLWVIPEGQWFCPPCQHNMLISKMSENLVEYDKILKKHENEVLRKQRLAFVGISLDNVIPTQAQQEAEEVLKSQKSKKHKRRVISSDDDEEDELMTRKDRFVVESDEESSRSNSAESDDEPMYKLRARRATKTFNFKEYDEMINSALRGQEDEYEEAEAYAESEEKAVAGIKNGGTPAVEDLPKKVSKGKVMPGDEFSDGDGEDEEAKEKEDKDESDEEEDVEEKEKRLKELETQSHRKTRRRLNDLDATSEEDSGSDFKGSDVDDDEDEEAEALDDDSDWSGDRDGEESDDSLARRGRGGKKGKYGRQEKYLEVGSVRRSTRRAKSRIIYDESDQSDDEDDPTPGWNSAESDASDSASVSEEDETWGKKKKKKAAYNPPRSKMRTEFFLPQKGTTSKSKAKPKASPKKKKKRVDDEEVDRAWNKHGSKVKKTDEAQEPVTDKRSTRGKKINFKDILDSGESDDDGNIHPKRRRVVAPDSDDSDAPSSSKKLVAELTAAQAKAAKASPGASKMKKPAADNDSSSDSEEEKMETSLLEQELKPVKAPPYPPIQHLAKKSAPPPIPSPVPPPQAPPSTNLMMSEILASTQPSTQATKNEKKVSAAVVTPGAPLRSTPPPAPVAPSIVRAPMVARAPAPVPAQQPGNLHRGISSPPHQAHPILPPNMPSEISRVPNPAYYPPNSQGMRNIFPWVRGPAPPPPYSQGPGSSPPQSIGKPPPLSSAPYMSAQQGPPPRSGYPSPPPLRIPNPSVSPLHSFQQFKRDPQMMYRMPPQGPPSRGPHPSLLAHMQSPPGHHERFYYGPAAPYGIPPPHTQSQPLYSAPQPQPFDYRPDEPFKDEPATQAAASPNPPVVTAKEETNSSQTDGEFGGLVSYFSSQRGDDDMDT